MDADVRAVMEAGMEAPSGENAQPWRFHNEGTTIELHHHKESDQSLYNYNNYGTLVCEGAALENMLIAARALGYTPRVALLPGSKTDCIARLELGGKNQPDREEEKLFSIMRTRTTNRKKYQKKDIPSEVGASLEKAAESFASDGIRLIRVKDTKIITTLARVASTNERIMLGNQELHHFFFNHLTWTEKEDKEKKVGFYIKTLELPPPIQGLFRLFKHWGVMRVLKAVGFPILVGKGNAATYASSAELGILTIPDMKPESFLFAGRAFERIWLTAVSHGLSAQPLTGTIFMNFFIENISQGHFSKNERTLISYENARLKGYCKADSGIPAIMYRIGYAPPASARATRFALEALLV